MILDTLTPTALGNALIASALAQGGKIVFTRCAVGSGIGGGDIKSMTSVAEEVGEYAIEAVTASDVSAVVVVKETTFSEPYYLREIGLFAKLGEGNEILFAAAREEESPEYIQPDGSALRDVSYTMQFMFSEASNVVVEMASVRYVRESQKGQPGGIPTLDENAKIPHEQIPVLHKELCRFTESGEFSPSDYPTKDGLYTIVLQGAGGGGSSANDGDGRNTSVQGGGAGGFAVICNVPLTSTKTYIVTVGKGGLGSVCGRNKIDHTEFYGENGGETTFGRFKVPGGNGGNCGSSAEIVVGAYVAENGDVGTGKELSSSAHYGGSSLFGTGGKCLRTASTDGEPGGIGSGGGALSCSYYGNAQGEVLTAGHGGDGLVIIYGIPK